MANAPQKPPKQPPPAKGDKAAGLASREAAALRANLRRRKAQAQALAQARTANPPKEAE